MTKRAKPNPRKAGQTTKAPAAPAASAPAPGAQPGELVSMDEAIQLLKTTRPTFYRWLRSGKLKGIKAGRQWRFYREELDRFLKGEAPRIEMPGDVGPLLNTLRARAKEAGVTGLSDASLAPAQLVVAQMIALGAGLHASDILLTVHIQEGGAENVGVLRYRIHGVLHTIATFDRRLLPGLVEEWKRLTACNLHEKQRPQDGRALIRVKERGDKPLDLRVSFLPGVIGEIVTARILDPNAVLLDLKRFDYAAQDQERILRAIRAPWGLTVITGPTGSGKTTTLYACLHEVTTPELQIMTAENPVEYLLPWATQVGINPGLGLTFERAIRSILRSDPDVIMVGEIRDLQTLNLVHESALTGHVVLTTLHASDAAGALKRMVDMGADPFVVADATKLAMSQRLVRRLCPHCSVEDPGPKPLDLAAEMARKGGLNWNALTPRFRKAVGCDKCGGTGYQRRSVISETLEVTPEIGKALRRDASVDELRTLAVGQGMTTMAADGIRRAAEGQTTLEEVLRVIG